MLPRLLAHGAQLPPPLTPLRLVTLSRPEPLLLLTVGAVALAYLLGVRAMHRRGDRWPPGRTVSFLCGGLGSILLVLGTGVAAYEDTLFSVHMAQHMVLSMVAPVFLALGAPVTLALRTLRPAGRRRLLAVLRSRPAAVIGFPVVGWALFVGSPFALYLSGWYAASLHSAVLHELVHVHFLLAGSLFLWPLLGVDPVPGRLAHPLRLVLLFATLPLHAFLGITVMGDRLIAAEHYTSIGRSLASVRADQQVGGGLLWASGELVGLLLLAVVTVQWMHASEREARREDRRLDRLDRLAPR